MVSLVWFGLVGLGFMAYQPFWLFNAKSSLYIYINYILFGLDLMAYQLL